MDGFQSVKPFLNLTVSFCLSYLRQVRGVDLPVLDTVMLLKDTLTMYSRGYPCTQTRTEYKGVCNPTFTHLLHIQIGLVFELKIDKIG